MDRMICLEGVATVLVAFKAFVFVEYEFSHVAVTVTKQCAKHLFSVSFQLGCTYEP